MDMLKTARTYASRANALKHLEKVAGSLEGLRYVVATTEDGRFAPVVVMTRPEDLGLIHHGVTVVG